MKADVVHDVFFVLGVAGLGAGVYHEWGTGFALIAVSVILLAVAIYGTMKS